MSVPAVSRYVGSVQGDDQQTQDGFWQPQEGEIEIMNQDNRWFLSTSEEINLIRHGLREVRDIPAHQNRVRKILDVVDTVQDRFA